jgi:phosphate transport system substrate-binding protein
LNLKLVLVAAALALAGCGGPAGNESADAASAGDITGAGSTFVYPLLSAWSADYHRASGRRINYQSIGSGGGIAQIKAGTVDFGASDKPLAPDELAESGLAQFPLAIGGVVPVVNIAGIGPGRLRLTGAVIAAIYLGRIGRWNDPAIVALNPGVPLPDAAIAVVHRSDGSGTTFNWSHYLAQVSPEWRDRVGEGTSVQWPTGIGGKGNEGVAAYVRQIPNSIGYIEYAFVAQNHMSWVGMRNAAGRFVAPRIASFQAAAASADWAHAPDFHLVMTNAPGAEAWPITAATFVLMHRRPASPARTAVALDFFRWALDRGQRRAEGLDYVPLPAPLVRQVEAYIEANIQ